MAFQKKKKDDEPKTIANTPGDEYKVNMSEIVPGEPTTSGYVQVGDPEELVTGDNRVKVESEAPVTDEEKEALKAAMKAYEEKIAGLEAKVAEMTVVETPDPNFYVFFHNRFSGDRVHLANGHIIEFKNRYARIPRENKTDYELMKKCALFGTEIVEVNRMVVGGGGVKITTGPMTAAVPKELTK